MKISTKQFVFIVLSLCCYVLFAYYLQRTDTLLLLGLYTTLFVCFGQLLQLKNYKTLLGLGIVFRLLFLFATPNLSQDFYRFIWDGQIALIGLNPYLTTPDYQMGLNILSGFPNQTELHNGMGSLSASHYTNYPPLNQLCFVIGNLFPGKSILSSVIGMRLIIIAADIGTLYFGKKLLERIKLPSIRIFWYLLNPFIIIELTGNLHFEGVMLFFLVWSLYLLHSGKWQWAAVVMACSVSVKLIPLMFLSLFFWWFISKKDKTSQVLLENSENTPSVNKPLSIKTLLSFYSIIGITTVLFFLPFFSMEFITNFSKTVGLWFGNFEFNASIYYLVRAIGYAITGYNEIAIIGKVLPVVPLLIILGLSFFKKNNTIPQLSASIVIAFSCYLFLSTTVHPWYISTLVLLCIFTKYRFPLVWSLAIILSYLAYSNTNNQENLWIIALEYSIVVSVFVWEVILKKPIKV